MARKYKSLDDILEDPEGESLLRIKERPQVPSRLERSVAALDDILKFVENSGRIPQPHSEDSIERLLARRLDAMQQNPERMKELLPFDSLGVLNEGVEQQAPKEKIEPSSLDDIFEMDDELLSGDEDDIFQSRHVSFENKEMPEEIAQRKRCGDFWRFGPLFDDVREQLRHNRAEKIRFNRESQIDEGDFFILDGVMCLVDEIGDDEGSPGRYNPRLRVIFDNETESNLLQRSLTRALYKDRLGRRILLDPDIVFDRAQGVTHREKRRGCIYVLRSKSNHPQLRGRKDIFKIGYTEGTVQDRVRGATRSSTYLESPVEIAATYDCYNLNPRRFETLIHGFLSSRRLNVILTDSNGKSYHPQEWFEIPLDTAKEVIKRIIDGTIVQYRLNRITGELVAK